MCPVNARLLPHEVQAYLEPHGIRAVMCSNAFISHFEGIPAGVRIAFGNLQSGNGSWHSAADIAVEESPADLPPATTLADPFRMIPTRSEERRVGKECGSQCRYRGAPKT